MIVAAPGDRVDGAELAEIDREAADAILAEEQAAALTKREGYKPGESGVRVFVQTEDKALDLPEDSSSWVEIRVPAPVAAVERPAS